MTSTTQLASNRQNSPLSTAALAPKPARSHLRFQGREMEEMVHAANAPIPG